MSNSKEKNEDLEGFIDFSEPEEESDEIEVIIDESGDTIIKIPEEEEKNIYRQSDQLVRDLKNNVMGKDILYKDRAPSARHSGLRPLRIAILTLINESSKYADQKKLMFMGLTLYEIQILLKPCSVSNHTIKDNLRKLVDLGLIQKKTALYTGKTTKITFYDIKLDSFPCKDGAYLLWDKDFRKRGLYVINCPRYPFCSLKKEDCKILRHLVKLVKILPKHIREHGIDIEDVDIEIPAHIAVASNNKDQSVVLTHKKQPKMHYKEAKDEEKNKIKAKIIELRNAKEMSNSFKECIETIIDEFEVDIGADDVYTIISNDHKKTKDVFTTTQRQSSVSHQLELKSFRDLTETMKNEVENRVINIIKGDFPKSWTDCVDAIREELSVVINEYNISTIIKKYN